jgi:hypothetical protein
VVVECSILVKFVVCGGYLQKLVVHGGEKVITPKFYDSLSLIARVDTNLQFTTKLYWKALLHKVTLRMNYYHFVRGIQSMLKPSTIVLQGTLMETH